MWETEVPPADASARAVAAEGMALRRLVRRDAAARREGACHRVLSAAGTVVAGHRPPESERSDPPEVGLGAAWAASIAQEPMRAATIGQGPEKGETESA